MKYDSAGGLDGTYGSGGKAVIDDWGYGSETPRDSKVLPDGSVLVAGSKGLVSFSQSIAVVKLLPTGTLDPAFGTNGKVATSLANKWLTGASLAIQPDGGRRPMSMDEEYVRTIFATEMQASNHPVAGHLYQGEIARSFRNSPQLLNRIGRSMAMGEARTKQGIVIPNVPMMKVEGNRVVRVLTKVTRGIFYAVNQRSLPTKWPVKISAHLDAQQAVTINVLMDQWKRNTGWWYLGADAAFRFKGAMENDKSHNSLWLLVFYKSLVFCASTLNPRART